MILPDTYSQMGRSTAGQLENLRRQLGVGIDPAYDYSQMNELRKTLSQKKGDKKAREEKGGSALEELRRALEKAGGPAAVPQKPSDEEGEAGEGGAEGSPQVGGAQLGRKAARERPSRAFLAPSRNDCKKHDVDNRIRAPPVGTYRPKMDLVDPREKRADFSMRSPTKSRKAIEVEKEVAELQSEGKSVEDFSKHSISVDYLDEAPERLKRRQAEVDFSKQTARPDMVKQSGIKYHDNSFTSGVLEGDFITSKLLRTPSWDFAKLSTTEDKPPETFFQPGQYKVDAGLAVTRSAAEVKNIPFTKQTKRKPMVEAVGLFEIKSRLGDHLPDRSMSRSCPALSTQSKAKVADFDKYSDRRPLVDPQKPYHRAEDPEVDQAVLQHSLTHDSMQAAKATWSRSRVDKFDSALKREEHLRSQRSYGNDVPLRMAKDNLTHGPVSVELLDEVGNSPQLRPRVLTRDFERMAPREAKVAKYKENPSRGKDMSDALRFEREARAGEGRAPTEVFSPSAGAIAEKRKTRTYSALGADGFGR